MRDHWVVGDDLVAAAYFFSSIQESNAKGDSPWKESKDGESRYSNLFLRLLVKRLKEGKMIHWDECREGYNLYYWRRHKLDHTLCKELSEIFHPSEESKANDPQLHWICYPKLKGVQRSQANPSGILAGELDFNDPFTLHYFSRHKIGPKAPQFTCRGEVYPFSLSAKRQLTEVSDFRHAAGLYSYISDLVMSLSIAVKQGSERRYSSKKPLQENEVKAEGNAEVGNREVALSPKGALPASFPRLIPRGGDEKKHVLGEVDYLPNGALIFQEVKESPEWAYERLLRSGSPHALFIGFAYAEGILSGSDHWKDKRATYKEKVAYLTLLETQLMVSGELLKEEYVMDRLKTLLLLDKEIKGTLLAARVVAYWLAYNHKLALQCLGSDYIRGRLEKTLEHRTILSAYYLAKLRAGEHLTAREGIAYQKCCEEQIKASICPIFAPNRGKDPNTPFPLNFGEKVRLLSFDPKTIAWLDKRRDEQGKDTPLQYLNECKLPAPPYQTTKIIKRLLRGRHFPRFLPDTAWVFALVDANQKKKPSAERGEARERAKHNAPSVGLGSSALTEGVENDQQPVLVLNSGQRCFKQVADLQATDPPLWLHPCEIEAGRLYFEGMAFKLWVERNPSPYRCRDVGRAAIKAYLLLAEAIILRTPAQLFNNQQVIFRYLKPIIVAKQWRKDSELNPIIARLVQYIFLYFEWELVVNKFLGRAYFDKLLKRTYKHYFDPPKLRKDHWVVGDDLVAAAYFLSYIEERREQARSLWGESEDPERRHSSLFLRLCLERLKEGKMIHRDECRESYNLYYWWKHLLNRQLSRDLAAIFHPNQAQQASGARLISYPRLKGVQRSQAEKSGILTDELDFNDPFAMYYFFRYKIGPRSGPLTCRGEAYPFSLQTKRQLREMYAFRHSAGLSSYRSGPEVEPIRIGSTKKRDDSKQPLQEDKVKAADKPESGDKEVTLAQAALNARLHRESSPPPRRAGGLLTEAAYLPNGAVIFQEVKERPQRAYERLLKSESPHALFVGFSYAAGILSGGKHKQALRATYSEKVAYLTLLETQLMVSGELLEDESVINQLTLLLLLDKEVKNILLAARVLAYWLAYNHESALQCLGSRYIADRSGKTLVDRTILSAYYLAKLRARAPLTPKEGATYRKCCEEQIRAGICPIFAPSPEENLNAPYPLNFAEKVCLVRFAPETIAWLAALPKEKDSPLTYLAECRLPAPPYQAKKIIKRLLRGQNYPKFLPDTGWVFALVDCAKKQHPIEERSIVAASNRHSSPSIALRNKCLERGVKGDQQAALARYSGQRLFAYITALEDPQELLWLRPCEIEAGRAYFEGMAFKLWIEGRIFPYHCRGVVQAAVKAYLLLTEARALITPAELFNDRKIMLSYLKPIMLAEQYTKDPKIGPIIARLLQYILIHFQWESVFTKFLPIDYLNKVLKSSYNHYFNPPRFRKDRWVVGDDLIATAYFFSRIRHNRAQDLSPWGKSEDRKGEYVSLFIKLCCNRLEAGKMIHWDEVSVIHHLYKTQKELIVPNLQHKLAIILPNERRGQREEQLLFFDTLKGVQQRRGSAASEMLAGEIDFNDHFAVRYYFRGMIGRKAPPFGCNGYFYPFRLAAQPDLEEMRALQYGSGECPRATIGRAGQQLVLQEGGAEDKAHHLSTQYSTMFSQKLKVGGVFSLFLITSTVFYVWRGEGLAAGLGLLSHYYQQIAGYFFS